MVETESNWMERFLFLPASKLSRQFRTSYNEDEGCGSWELKKKGYLFLLIWILRLRWDT